MELKREISLLIITVKTSTLVLYDSACFFAVEQFPKRWRIFILSSFLKSYASIKLESFIIVHLASTYFFAGSQRNMCTHIAINCRAFSLLCAVAASIIFSLMHLSSIVVWTLTDFLAIESKLVRLFHNVVAFSCIVIIFQISLHSQQADLQPLICSPCMETVIADIFLTKRRNGPSEIWFFKGIRQSPAWPHSKKIRHKKVIKTALSSLWSFLKGR